MITIIILLSILPLIQKTLFWSYIAQLKDYRIDRLKDLFISWDFKKAFVNNISILELSILGILSIFSFAWKFDFFAYIIIFSLILENIYVLLKILKKSIIKPKITSKLLLLLFIYFIVLSWISYFPASIFAILDKEFYYLFIAFLSLFINLVYLLIPFFVLISIIILLPLNNYLKSRVYKKASNKSETIENVIKIGITWSYGKSTTKEFLYSILASDWKTLETPENINTEMWVSWIILSKLNETYKYFIAEMWAYRIWEIKTLWEIVGHKYAFLTAIAPQHLSLFWSLENIIKAKTEIAIEVEKNNWILYANFDNENIAAYNFSQKLNLVSYAIDDKNALARWEIIDINTSWSKFRFIYKDVNLELETNIIWKQNILNLIWVLAFAVDMWINIDLIKESIKFLKLPKNTLDIKKLENNIIFIDDTYNSSIDSVLASSSMLSYFKDYKKIIILDDILELWSTSSALHEKLWESLAKLDFDKIILIGKNHKENIEIWLIKWWIKKENISYNLETLESNSIYLFKWRWTRIIKNKFDN